MPTLLHAATLLAALGACLVAGIFFAFSSFVMRALADQSAPAGIRAMQAINIRVINPLFMAAFMGTGLACLALLTAALVDPDATGTGLRLAGSLLYLAGSIGVTLAGNVPLNNALAKADPESAGGAALWQDYLARWTRWNHVRTAASLAAAFMLAIT